MRYIIIKKKKRKKKERRNVNLLYKEKKNGINKLKRRNYYNKYEDEDFRYNSILYCLKLEPWND